MRPTHSLYVLGRTLVIEPFLCKGHEFLLTIMILLYW